MDGTKTKQPGAIPEEIGNGRRALLMRLGLLALASYIAPAVLSLSESEASPKRRSKNSSRSKSRSRIRSKRRY